MDTRGADSYRHDLLMELFEEVCDLSASDRSARLDELCVGTRAPLRPELERLLAGDVVGESLIDTKPTLAPPPRLETQDTIGRYRVLGRLGEGGMGLVFEAEQENPKRRVALKVLKHHGASEDVERRFEHEASLLGRLHHPAVAQVYEAGTADGQRFIAMELVDGVRLDDYLVDLGLEDILKLVATVCDGVQHAHHNGVLHRDLKPANVLVEADGSPKILDFGVGRALEREDNEEKTLAGEIIGTLAYMSPEQVLGNPDQIDTRCDVYALGVILYRFLTGAPPIDVSSVPMLDAVQRIVQDEPRPLRSHAPHVPADVAAIVHTAIAKEKERRYSSAAELASDLRRFLSGDTVSARPSTTWYVLSKFTRRNKGLVVASALVLVSLLLGLGAASVGFARAARERDRATEEVQAKGAVLEYLVGLLEVFDPETQGSTVTVREMLDVGAERLETELLEQPQTRLLLMQTLAALYTNLGLAEPAGTLCESILAQLLRTVGPDSPQALQAQTALVGALVGQFRLKEASAELEDLCARQDRILDEEHPNRIASLSWRASILFEQGLYEEAHVVFLDMLAKNQRLHGPDAPETLRNLSMLAAVTFRLGRFEEAEGLCRDVLERTGRSLGDEHHQTLAPSEHLGVMLSELGRYEEAEEQLLAALELHKRIYGEEHPQIIVLQRNLGALYRDVGRNEDAFEMSLDTLERSRSILGDDHPHTMQAISQVAVCHVDSQRHAEAAALLEEIIEPGASTLGRDHPFVVSWSELLAGCYYHLRRYIDAEPLLVDAVVAHERIYGHDHPDTGLCLANLAWLYWQTDRRERAIECMEGALEIFVNRLGERHPSSVQSLRDLAEFEAAVDPDRAFELLARAVDAGFSDADGLVTDDDLIPLRGPEFDDLVAAVRANAAADE